MLIDAGGRALRTHKRQIHTSNPQVARVAAVADDAFRQLELTVVCVHCGGTPTCQNHPTDTHWKMECACCVRVLSNPTVQ